MMDGWITVIRDKKKKCAGFRIFYAEIYKL